MLLAAVIAVAGGTTELAGQGKVSFEGQGGVALPAGRLADFVDPGLNTGLGLTYQLSPRVALVVDGGVDVLNGVVLGGQARAPDMRLWRYGGGVAANVLPVGRWSLVTSLGAGATRFSSDEFSPPGTAEPRTFEHTYFTSNAGLKLGYGLGSRITTYVGARGVWAAASQSDTEALAELDPASLRPFGSAITVPVTVGLNLRTGGARRPARAAAPRGQERVATAAAVDRERLEADSRKLCEEAEAALERGELERARALYRRAKAEYPGTLCADAADVQLEKVAAIQVIGERVHFEYDRSRITDAGAAVLQRKAAVLKRYPQLRLTIEGHCDERGSVEYNQALGLRRADASARYLVALGLPETMFETVTYGKDRPLAAGSGEGVWSRNRRSEFVVRNLGAM